ncbi:MAG: NAD-dependent malic enzyme [Firmicutes bacterium]|nr:NAD-dependent malic enzyme [Bacillota bacterium]
MIGRITSAIGTAGGDIGAIDIIQSRRQMEIRDFTVRVQDEEHQKGVVDAISAVPGVKIIATSDRIFLAHLGGKVEVQAKMPVKNRDDLSIVYTPGVAQVCRAIADDPAKAFSLTIKHNTVAIVTDGTAILGLGDLGPLAALPVMEGKAMLFKQFGGVDAFPICLDTKDPDEIVETVKRIAPVFGGINLEDISAPRCFEIEERLARELDIPVMHDDQHGTAAVVLAGIMNAVKIVGKRLADLTVVVCGIGAAGMASSKILMAAGVKNIIGVDRHGALVAGEAYTNPAWQWYAEHTNPEKRRGSLSDVIAGADVFIGVSGPGALKVDDVKKMAHDPIVFAMANPSPEIDPEEAAPYVRVMATGRSDFPNQVNNLLAFPGIFRGALECRARAINDQMKIAASKAIASVVGAELHEDYIIPSVFNRQVTEVVTQAVMEAAYSTGVARKERAPAPPSKAALPKEPWEENWYRNLD